jgi:hypothetical protein
MRSTGLYAVSSHAPGSDCSDSYAGMGVSGTTLVDLIGKIEDLTGRDLGRNGSGDEADRIDGDERSTHQGSSR